MLNCIVLVNKRNKKNCNRLHKSKNKNLYKLEGV